MGLVGTASRAFVKPAQPFGDRIVGFAQPLLRIAREFCPTLSVAQQSQPLLQLVELARLRCNAFEFFELKAQELTAFVGGLAALDQGGALFERRSILLVG